MQTTFYVLGTAFILFFIYVVYSVRKMKNMPAVQDSDKIKVLNNSNFKIITRQGLILVDFWAPWCAPCRMMAPILNEIAESDNSRVTIAKLNVDHEKQLAQKFKVRGIPTMILFNKGKEVKRFVGVKSKQFLLNEISRAG